MEIGKPYNHNINKQPNFLVHLSHEVNIASVPSSYTLKPYHHAILDDECENLVKVIHSCEIMTCYYFYN